MCYSGICHFENSYGDCTVVNYDEFKNQYHVTPCQAGGYPELTEADKLNYIKNKDKFQRICKDYDTKHPPVKYTPIREIFG